MLAVVLPDGARVSYAVYGDPEGQPVLALHGAPACRLMFAPADAPARSLRLKLICPDRPGYADSTGGAVLPSLEARTDWLAAFVQAIGLERFALLAISGGAPYAVALAARLGPRITAMALASPMGPAADDGIAEQGRRDLISFLQKRFFLHLGRRLWFTRTSAALIGSVARRWPQRMLALSAFLAGRADAEILGRHNVRAMLAPMMQEAFRNGGEGSAGDLYIFGRPWGIDYAAVTAPCTLWLGTADTIVPVAVARRLASQLPHCRFIELPGAGHFWVVEHIEEVLQEVATLARAGTGERSGAGSAGL